MKATWQKEVIAERNETIGIEGNHYFPHDAVNKKFLKTSDTTTTCPWKGKASYYLVEVNGEVNKDAAWYYSDPKEAAKEIKDYIAFWKGVKVEA